MSDTYYERPSPRAADGYQPETPCEGYLPDDTRVAPRDLEAQLVAVAAYLDPTPGFPLPGRVTIDRVVGIVKRLAADAAAMPVAVDVECGYDGVVDASYSHGVVSWECPRCGNAMEEEPGR